MKIRVENLANIKEADIEVKNLTLFVGQNSTHKSYMAHTVYELYKEISSIKNNWNKKNRLISIISKNLLSKYEKEISEILLLEKDISEEIARYEYNEDHIETEIFTTIRIKIDKNKSFQVLQEKAINLVLQELRNIINSSFNSPNSIIERIFLENLNFHNENENEYIIIKFNIPLEHFVEEKEDLSSRIVNNTVSKILVKFEKVLVNHQTAYYFPASRTGFVLTLDEIYAGIFRDKFRGQVSATRLGEPTIDFIQTFADIKTGKQSEWNPFNFNLVDNKEEAIIKELTSFLETNIIKGKIKEKRNEQNYKSYFLGVNNKEIDLHLASSATLETLPFIVFIKNTDKISKTLFVIEEPEAHLHPKAQIQMAKFLVLLSNCGAKVVVTTHSDYILNEINNCIKLNSVDADKESKRFVIDKENVSAYLFKNNPLETTVNGLEIDKFGISNENFDEVLNELLDRSSELSEKILENE